MAYRDVRIPEAGNRLAFRFDPIEDLIEIRMRGETYVVDLDWYRTPFDRPLTQQHECANIQHNVDSSRVDGALGDELITGERIIG